jgi:hypothetical protein
MENGPFYVSRSMTPSRRNPTSISRRRGDVIDSHRSGNAERIDLEGPGAGLVVRRSVSDKAIDRGSVMKVRPIPIARVGWRTALTERAMRYCFVLMSSACVLLVAITDAGAQAPPPTPYPAPPAPPPPPGVVGTWDFSIAYGSGSCRGSITLQPDYTRSDVSRSATGGGYVTCNVNNYSAYNTFSFSPVPQNERMFTFTMTAPGEPSWKGTVRIDRKNQGPWTLEGTTDPRGTEYAILFKQRPD